MSKPAPAFISYLLEQPRHHAILHIMDCLKNGPQDNEAWALIEHVHGDPWACKPEELYVFLNLTLDVIKLERDNANNAK